MQWDESSVDTCWPHVKVRDAELRTTATVMLGSSSMDLFVPGNIALQLSRGNTLKHKKLWLFEVQIQCPSCCKRCSKRGFFAFSTAGHWGSRGQKWFRVEVGEQFPLGHIMPLPRTAKTCNAQKENELSVVLMQQEQMELSTRVNIFCKHTTWTNLAHSICSTWPKALLGTTSNQSHFKAYEAADART